MLLPEAAWLLLEAALAERAPLPARRTARAAAAGRRLAEALVATTDLPSADISALDGFALAGPLPAPGDGGSESGYRITGTALAGGGAPPPLSPGEAARIMTGAPAPPGADRVVGFEDVEADGERVRPRVPVAAGAALRRRGEIRAAGEPLFAAGVRLGPAALALLASQAIDEVDCYPAPRVEILVTGDEVVRGPVARPGEVRDSHRDFLAAELARLGVEPLVGPVVRDDRAALEKRLAEALDRADLVLTCGGVSMGDADLVPDTLARLGCRTLFHGVAVQPGKPLLAAVRDRRLIFGLPGNPGSVMTSFWLFVKPVVDRLAGGTAGFWEEPLTARLTRELGPGRGRDRFVPAKVAVVAGRLEAEPTSPKGSHDLHALAAAQGLLRVRAGDAARAAGEEIELLLVDR